MTEEEFFNKYALTHQAKIDFDNMMASKIGILISKKDKQIEFLKKEIIRWKNKAKRKGWDRCVKK